MLTIIDMNMGNLNSVCHALQRLGFAFRVTCERQGIEDASVLLLPGVGTFGQGMAALQSAQLVDPIRRAVQQRGMPILGICVGMQLLARTGDEFGRRQGLDLIPGQVFALPKNKGLVPHMGWGKVNFNMSGKDFLASDTEPVFYFAHSYHFQCDNPANQAAVVSWGGLDITAVVSSGNIVGVQFHPEKSQDAGLTFLHSVLHSMLAS